MSHPPQKPLMPVGSILKNVLKNNPRKDDDMDMLKVFDLWEDAVGESVSMNAKPAAFKGDLLLVHVSSSAWMHHLYFQQNELIEKINKSLGNNRVRELKFKIGCF